MEQLIERGYLIKAVRNDGKVRYYSPNASCVYKTYDRCKTECNRLSNQYQSCSVVEAKLVEVWEEHNALS